MSPVYAPAPTLVYPWTLAGLLGWSFDNACATSSGIVANVGLIYVAKIQVPVTITVSNIIVRVETIGSVLTSGQNLVGAYDSAGNLLATSADQTTAWGTTGVKTAAVTPFTVTGGPTTYIYGALLANGSTGPQFQRPATNDSSSGMSGAALRFARTTAPGATSLTNPITPSGLASTNNYWFGVS